MKSTDQLKRELDAFYAKVNRALEVHDMGLPSIDPITHSWVMGIIHESQTIGIPGCYVHPGNSYAHADLMDTLRGILKSNKR